MHQTWVGIKVRVIDVFGRHANISGAEIDALNVLSTAFPESGLPGVPVPLVELVAHGLLILSLAGACIGIITRRRTRKCAVSDSWEHLPTVDVAVKVFTVVSVADLVASLVALLIMCLPIVHDGAFAACVYAAHGILDNIPWVFSLHRGQPTANALARSAVLVCIIAAARVCSVVNQPPSTACRVWLILLALTYTCSSLGYLLFLTFDIPATTAMWVGEAALYLYALGVGPALYITFVRERAYWRQTGHRTPLDSASTQTPPSFNKRWHPDGGARLLEHMSPSTSEKLPTLQAAPGSVTSADSHGAGLLRQALRGVRIVQPEELCMHELIGSGGFADVFRTTWTDRTAGSAATRLGAGGKGRAPVSEVLVAVKQLRSLPREHSGVEAFCKEIALMQRLQHPNVLSMLGVSISHTGTLAVLTQYLARGSVFQMLHPRTGPGSPLPRVLAMRMLADCATGMSYLHACSPPIIHRDLKSQNLLVGTDFRVKVADFGLSRECLQPGAMTRVGSVQWAAPEVLLGQSYSHKCDLWSFGVVCWEVLTACVPFEGMAQTAVATKVAMEGLRLPVPPHTPRRLLRLIARCWLEDAGQRPDFESVVGELNCIERELLAAGEPNPSPPVGAS